MLRGSLLSCCQFMDVHGPTLRVERIEASTPCVTVHRNDVLEESLAVFIGE